MKTSILVGVLLAAFLSLSPGQARAEEEAKKPPRHRAVYSNLLAGRYNPMGLVNRYKMGYRLRLWDRPGVLFKDTYLSVLATTMLNPAFGMAGARIEVKPLAVISLWAEYSYVGTFGTFGILQSFPSPSAEHSDTRLDENDELDLAYVTSGQELNLGMRLQAKIWNIAVRDTLDLHYTSMDLRQGDTVYYNQAFDTLVPNEGWVLKNELDLLYLFGSSLVLGLRYTMIHALYPESAYGPGEPTNNPSTPTHRVGPLAAYTFFKRPGSLWDAPTLILMVQWWAQHRYRTGADSHGALPLLLLGLHFTGDLIPWMR